jgi:uncharacterized membrane protein YfcA
VVFGVVLLYSAYLSFRPKSEHVARTPDPLAARLRLDGSYPTPEGDREYHVQRVPLGFGLMFGAGALSGLLGIGSGAVKVLAMDQVMCLPFKVSATTSNFMIGVTAAASAGVYFARGQIDPFVAAPVALGVLAGAFAGSYTMGRIGSRAVRIIFVIVLALISVQMLLKGIHG